MKALLRINTTIGAVLLLLLWQVAPALAQKEAPIQVPKLLPFQLRVTGFCLSGSSISKIHEDGTVLCQKDVTIDGSITAIGSSALQNNTSGIGNTASGFNALQHNTTGSNNTASGASALRSNTAGVNNTASGVDALLRNSTGHNNTASGTFALRNNNTGGFNTASGASALLGNTSGQNNTASGVNALSSNTTGNFNTASGTFALGNNNTGGFNTASGASALSSNTTGSGNTAIGRNADVSSGSLTNATAIGFQAIVDASNKIRLGNNDVTLVETAATIFALGVITPSDATRKENFQPVEGEGVLKKFQGLTLTSWNYIGHDPKQLRHYGPTAQEFFAAFGSDGIGTIGTPTTINSGDMAGILMIAVQALERRTAEQRAANESLRAENTALLSRLEALESALRTREALAQR